jgi:outer membrane cobalamin receptor
VVDPDGRPVTGARVMVAGSAGPLQSVFTTEDGRFDVAAPASGRVAVRVSMDGFRSEPIWIDASPDARDLGTVTMAISAVSEAVIVTASQVESPATLATSSITVIGGAELEARQIHSVAEALRTVPGLTLVTTGGLGANTNLFPRGGESNYTLALIDGVPVNAFGGDFDFGQIATINVDRIEIVRGPQSALFGSNAIGAVVRVVTRRGGAPSGQIHVEGGHLDTTRIAAATSGEAGAFEWGGSFERLASDGMNGRPTAGGETIANDDYERTGGAVSAGWRRDGAWLRGDVRHSVDERGFPGPFGSNPIGAYGGIDLVSRGNNDRTQASLTAVVPLTTRLRVQGLVGYHRLDSAFASSFGGSDSFSRRRVGRVQADLTVHPSLDASAGVEVQRERAGSTFITGSTFQEIPITRRTAGYFGEARWNHRNRLFVTTGVRIEDIHRERIEPAGTRPDLVADDGLSVNPRLTAAWLPRGDGGSYTRIRGAVGRGIRPPDAFELAFTDNPALKPERSVSAEAGVDRAFLSGRGLVEATAFFNEYDDLIVAVGSFSGSSRYRTDNISNARSRGLELAVTLRGRVPARHAIDLTGRFGYTRLATRILAVDRDNAAPPPFEVGQRLLRRPGHQFFADLAAAVGPVSAFLRGGGRGAVLDVEPSFGTFGGLFDARGYHVWSAGAAVRVLRHAEAFVRIENLLDRSYEEAFGFPAPGRRATAGLRVAAGR